MHHPDIKGHISHLLKYVLDLWGFRIIGLCWMSCMDAFLINFLKQVPIYFSFSGECCNAVLLGSSRNCVNNKNCTSFHRHGSTQMMPNGIRRPPYNFYVSNNLVYGMSLCISLQLPLILAQNVRKKRGGKNC